MLLCAGQVSGSEGNGIVVDRAFFVGHRLQAAI